MQFCLRDLCRAVGSLSTAPVIEDINAAQMNVFYAKVSVHHHRHLLVLCLCQMKELCPQVAGSRK